MTVCPKPATGAASAMYYVEEDTCGITPENPAWTLLRRTSGNLQLTKDSLTSNELDGSRDRADTRLGQDQTSGDIAVEMSYGSHDDLYAALLGSSWTPGPADLTGETITVDAANKTFTGSTDFTGLIEVGQLVQFPGLSGNNALPVLITGVDTTVLSVAAVANDFLTDESGSTDVAFAESVVIGSDCRSFSILEEYPDLDNGNGGYTITRGVKIVNLSFNMAVNALNTATFQTLGLSQEVNAELPAGSTFIEAPKTEIYAGVDGSILEDGQPIGFVTGADATTDTEASAQFELGDKSVSFIEQGRVLSDLTLSSFFVDYTQLEKFIAETEQSIYLLMESGDGSLMFSYPRTIYTSGAPEVSGPGSITQTLGASAFKPDGGSSIVISRMPGPAPAP